VREDCGTCRCCGVGRRFSTHQWRCGWLRAPECRLSAVSSEQFGGSFGSWLDGKYAARPLTPGAESSGADGRVDAGELNRKQPLFEVVGLAEDLCGEFVRCADFSGAEECGETICSDYLRHVKPCGVFSRTRRRMIWRKKIWVCIGSARVRSCTLIGRKSYGGLDAILKRQTCGNIRLLRSWPRAGKLLFFLRDLLETVPGPAIAAGELSR